MLGRCRAGLSEIAVEDPNLLWVPTEGSGLVQQVYWRSVLSWFERTCARVDWRM